MKKPVAYFKAEPTNPEHTPEEIARYVAAGKEALKYGWYIRGVFQDKIDRMQRSITDGKKSLETPLPPTASPRSHDMERGMRNMLSQVEFALKDYQRAFDALKKVGIE